MSNAPVSQTAKMDVYHPPLVITIHGIRTHAEWQKEFPGVIGNKAGAVEAFDFGRYGLLRFLTPASNNSKIDQFYQWYSTKLREHPEVDLTRYDRRPSVVAHSFGTWIVGYTMLKHPDVKFDKLLLFGCILPRDFDWLTLFGRDQVGFVRNERGLKDPWPNLAGKFVARAGTAGSKGFEWFRTVVEDVPYEFEHSTASMRAHMQSLWVPFLCKSPSPLGILHGHDIQDRKKFEKTLDYTGTIIDKEAYAKLPHYFEDEIPRGLSLTWIRINPDIYTFLIDRHSGKPAGYMNAMPLEEAAYEKVRSGKLADNQITAGDILPFETNREIKIYLMSVVVAEKHRRYGDGIFQQGYIHLLTGFVDKLAYYATNESVRVTHLLATAWSEVGARM